MKKLFAAVCTALMISVMGATLVAQAATPTYAEWHYDRFGQYPGGTVDEWESDPVYWQYLSIYDQKELEEVNKRTNGGNSDADPCVITDAYWSGSTAKWKDNGIKASKYQVRLYRDSTKIKSETVTTKSYSFQNDFPKDGDYWFEVRAYGKSKKEWSDWYSSEDKYFKKSTGSSNNGNLPSNPGNPSGQGNGWSNRWAGSGETWAVVNAQGNGYIANSWWQDPATGEWYLIGCTGVPGKETIMSAGLFQDAAGNWYLLNPLHDGTYGRMLSGDANGYYILNINGQSVGILFNKQHDGTYGKILSDVTPVYNALGGGFKLGFIPPTAP